LHEVGIASSILETVGAEARRRPDSQIIAVGIRIGELSNIDKVTLAQPVSVARNSILPTWKWRVYA
jgi:Zn finger protein HypA/HybF involved in hydrogenase expression